MKHKINRNERGQVLVLVAVVLIGLLAILALVLDGGNTYAKRREAQNAADAGALAGARTYCLSEDVGQANFKAQQYATVYNDASSAAVTVDTDNKQVEVTTFIPYDTFFLHLVGANQITAQASASAGCFPPTTGETVLPVAWACRRPPIDDPDYDPDQENCEGERIPMEGSGEGTLPYYVQYPTPQDADPTDDREIWPELYIVMNSNAQPDDLAAFCISSGGWIPCDVDGDGDDDLIAHGDRSWLDLDGAGGGASELRDWIDNGFPGTILWHTWIGGQSGVTNAVFQSVADHVGEIAVLPVFDLICDDNPDPNCADLMHTEDVVLVTAGGSYYYHVIGFAGFYISCVEAAGVPGSCPGHTAAEAIGALDANVRTIEGYFVSGIVPGVGGGPGGGGIDTGIYSLYLTR